jgi:hypothetical protein
MYRLSYDDTSDNSRGLGNDSIYIKYGCTLCGPPIRIETLSLDYVEERIQNL